MPYIQQYLFQMESANIQEKEILQELETIPVPGS